MQKKLSEIAALIGAELSGDGDISVTGVSGIKEAHVGDITFLANQKYMPLLETTEASAIIVGRDIPDIKLAHIRCDNPSLTFSKVIELMGPPKIVYTPGVHSTAVIGKNVTLGQDVCVQAHVVIEDGCTISDKTVIGAGTYIGHYSEIGPGCLIYPNVVVRERTILGERVVIHSGTVIGSDGFGFVMREGKHIKIPQIGTVMIEDDVEIGANVTIDRARFDKTIIKKGTKIDNLVQIAHNVVVGEHCILVAHSGIAGSTTLGNYVTMAAQAGAVGHLSIGDRAIIAAQAGVTKDIAAGAIVVGAPAVDHMKFKKNVAMTNRLGKLYDKVNQLDKKVKELQEKGSKET
ncbi:MAG: UDP-3-O-(3-hydroxymyristoyl)glucosamine N-acyltransferase [Candidatus Ancaeobacter aquaticus]|nr:UDP-3-O-(3-hydroxymyristoyl)glucosamine N-acyltransferase [Candidatus Ancaeobacter aquaticus]